MCAWRRRRRAETFGATLATCGRGAGAHGGWQPPYSSKKLGNLCELVMPASASYSLRNIRARRSAWMLVILVMVGWHGRYLQDAHSAKVDVSCLGRIHDPQQHTATAGAACN
jgi:hypothetical protein